MKDEFSGNSTILRCQKNFATLLAWRFAPFDFSFVPGFPHLVPDISVWGYFLLVFKEKEEDNPAEHLLKFHKCMDILGQQHEDVHVFIIW